MSLNQANVTTIGMRLFSDESSVDTLLGGSGNDTLQSTNRTPDSAGDVLDGGAGNDWLSAGFGSNQLFGGQGNDTLSLAQGWADGGLGDDILRGEFFARRVELHGGQGNDTLTLYSGGEAHGDEGNDFLSDQSAASDGPSLLVGGDGNDDIGVNTSYQDTVIGGRGNDVIRLSPGHGEAHPGGSFIRVSADSGFDTVSRYQTPNDTTPFTADVIELGTDIRLDTLQTRMDGRDLTLSWSDNAQGRSGITLQGFIRPDGLSMTDYVVRQGSTTLDLREQALAPNANASTGDDLLVGRASLPDTLRGDAGNDTLLGREGGGLLAGELGRDLLMGGADNDTLQGGWDADTLRGDAGHDLLQGGQGKDLLEGGAGDDTLQGGDGDDLIHAGTGRDLLQGGAGADTLYALNDSTFVGGSGNDLLSAGHGTRNTFVIGRHGGQDRAGATSMGWEKDLAGELVSVPSPAAGFLVGNQTVRWVDGIRPDEVTVQQTGTAITLALKDGSSQLWLNLGSDGHLSQVQFDDGTVWDEAGVRSRVAPTTGTSQSSTGLSDPTPVTLTGGAGNDTLFGRPQDTLIGGQGNDDLSVTHAFGEAAHAPGALLEGGQGRDGLQGSEHEDTLVGGTSMDYLRGFSGLDTYVFNLGDGADTIEEFSWCGGTGAPSLAQEVQIKLGAGIRREDLRFSRGDSSDLIIRIMGGPGDADRIRLANYFFGNVSGQFITLADGTRLGTDDVAAYLTAHPWSAPVTTGTSGKDTLTPMDHGRVFAGGAGADTYIWGNQAGDTYVADTGDGTGLSTDVLQLTANIRPEQVHLSLDDRGGASINGWTLRADDTEGSITVNPADGNALPFTRLPSIRFADGTTWSQDTIIAKLRAGLPEHTTWWRGGNDTISQGFDGRNAALGGAGSDTYLIGRSSPIQRIAASSSNPGVLHNPWQTNWQNSLYLNPTQPQASDVDTLRFTDGIRPEDVQATLATNGDLRLSVRHSEVNVLIDQFALNDGSNSEVDRVAFDDGTTWGRDVLLNLANQAQGSGWVLQAGQRATLLSGEDGNDWLRGGNGRDTLDGSSGRDTLMGGAGNDTYIVDRVDDVVQEAAGSGRDTVRASVSWQAADEIEVVQLLGSAQLNATGRATQTTRLVGNDGDNLLRGGSAFDVLSGLLGTDTLIGGDGGDFYRVIDTRNQIIEQASDSGMDAVFSLTEELTLADNVEVLYLASDVALIGHGNAGDNTLYGRNIGSTLDGQGGDDLLLGAAGDDELMGGAGDDTLQGGAGADVYVWQRGDGTDTIVNDDRGSGSTDTLWLDGVSLSDLRFSRAGNDLLIDVMGTGAGRIQVEGWALGADQRLEQLQCAEGRFATSAIAPLVQAMAASGSLSGSALQLGDTVKPVTQPIGGH